VGNQSGSVPQYRRAGWQRYLSIAPFPPWRARRDGFNILATFAEFEAGLIRMLTREGMAITRAEEKLRGQQPNLVGPAEVAARHSRGQYLINALAELFSITHPTVAG
jgi:hypothetical protein